MLHGRAYGRREHQRRLAASCDPNASAFMSVVVETIWTMADTDRQDLAVNFYKSLFFSKELGIRYY